MDMHETIPVGRAELTAGGMIRHYCLCGTSNFHEVGEVGRIVVCTCNRMYCVPSPPSLPLLDCEAHRRMMGQCVNLPNGRTLVLNVPIVSPAEWNSGTTPKHVVLKKKSASRWLVPFLAGLIFGLFVLSIVSRIPTIARLFR